MYVTHHRVEAVTLSDRVVVLDDGELQQFARPQQRFQVCTRRAGDDLVR